MVGSWRRLGYIMKCRKCRRARLSVQERKIDLVFRVRLCDECIESFDRLSADETSSLFELRREMNHQAWRMEAIRGCGRPGDVSTLHGLWYKAYLQFTQFIYEWLGPLPPDDEWPEVPNKDKEATE